MDNLLQYIDALWLFIAVIVVHKGQRWHALGLIVGCMVLMRMQIELMYVIGFPNGLVGLMPSINAFERAIGVYSLFYMICFVVLHFSPKEEGSILLATSIGMFFMVFLTSTVLMIL